MEKLLNKFFSIKEYGNDIEEFVSIIPILPKQEPYIREEKNIYSKKIKRLIVIRNADYEIFTNATPKEFQRLLAEKILTTIEEMDKMRFKLKDFDKEQFYEDARSLAVSQGWLEATTSQSREG